MSDSSQGPGWWQASDGKWYPPVQAPGSAGGATAGGGAPATVDIGAALTYGWNKFTQYVGQLILVVLAMFAIMVVFFVLAIVMLAIFGGGLFGQLVALGVLFLGFGVGLAISRGLVRCILDITEGIEFEASKLFNFENIGPYALTAILYGVILGVGYMFCIIPGVVASLFLWFWPFAVVDKDMGPTDALTASFELVKNNFAQVILFLIVINVINGIGASFCGLGLLVTIPFTFISSAYVWKALNGEPVTA